MLFQLDVVGDVSGGINAACWSPDMETLVLVSGTGNVLLMSRTWDVLQEIPLFQKDYGEGFLMSHNFCCFSKLFIFFLFGS